MLVACTTRKITEATAFVHPGETSFQGVKHGHDKSFASTLLLEVFDCLATALAPAKLEARLLAKVRYLLALVGRRTTFIGSGRAGRRRNQGGHGGTLGGSLLGLKLAHPSAWKDTQDAVECLGLQRHDQFIESRKRGVDSTVAQSAEEAENLLLNRAHDLEANMNKLICVMGIENEQVRLHDRCQGRQTVAAGLSQTMVITTADVDDQTVTKEAFHTFEVGGGETLVGDLKLLCIGMPHAGVATLHLDQDVNLLLLAEGFRMSSANNRKRGETFANESCAGAHDAMVTENFKELDRALGVGVLACHTVGFQCPVINGRLDLGSIITLLVVGSQLTKERGQVILNVLFRKAKGILCNGCSTALSERLGLVPGIFLDSAGVLMSGRAKSTRRTAIWAPTGSGPGAGGARMQRQPVRHQRWWKPTSRGCLCCAD